MAGQAPSGLGGLEVADHVVEAGAVDRVSGAAGRDCESDGDVRLAHSARLERGSVGLGFDEGKGGEVFDLARVELGLERKVVVVQCFVVWQLRDPQAGAEAAVVTDGEFFGENQVAEVEVAHLCFVGPLSVLSQGLGQVGQAQLAGRVADAGGDQLAQDDSFALGLVVKGRVPVSSS